MVRLAWPGQNPELIARALVMEEAKIVEYPNTIDVSRLMR